MATKKSIRLGIDFGTTTTAVSLREGEALATVLPIGDDGATLYMPSVVFFPAGSTDLLNQPVVGEKAERITGGGTVVHSIKRCLGCLGHRCSETGGNRLPWCQGDGQVHIPGMLSLRPEKVVLLIFREALERAIKAAYERHGIDLRSADIALIPVNIGCPAAFGLDQRTLLLQAAYEVGLGKALLSNVVEEPILAGFAFSRFNKKPEGRVLIYDFGGGSFDTAVLDIDRVGRDQRITVLSTAGEPWLGGDDIDALVMQHLVSEIAKSLDVDAQQVWAELGALDTLRLRLLARSAKEQLSVSLDFSNVLFSDSFGIVPLDMTRSKLESLVLDSKVNGKNLIDRSLDAVLRACKMAYAFDVAVKTDLLDVHEICAHSLDQAAQTIDRVVLVGGVTKMPMVRAEIVKFFGESKIETENVIEPITVVAMGAAYPRGPQHYSLAFPPFEFVLELQEGSETPAKRMPIFHPYEYYRFHEELEWSCVAVHRSERVRLKKNYRYARLGFRKVGDVDWTWHDVVGQMPEGDCEFRVGMDGQMRLRFLSSGRREQSLGDYPLVHPVQEAIVHARDVRERQRDEKQLQRADERKKTIATEN